jgi:hypothetical protein
MKIDKLVGFNGKLDQFADGVTKNLYGWSDVAQGKSYEKFRKVKFH